MPSVGQREPGAGRRTRPIAGGRDRRWRQPAGGGEQQLVIVARGRRGGERGSSPARRDRRRTAGPRRGRSRPRGRSPPPCGAASISRPSDTSIIAWTCGASARPSASRGLRAAIGGEQLGRARRSPRAIAQAGAGVADRAGDPQRVARAARRCATARATASRPIAVSVEDARRAGGQRHGVAAEQRHVECAERLARARRRKRVPGVVAPACSRAARRSARRPWRRDRTGSPRPASTRRRRAGRRAGSARPRPSCRGEDQRRRAARRRRQPRAAGCSGSARSAAMNSASVTILRASRGRAR